MINRPLPTTLLRIGGALLFLPIIGVFVASQTLSQWLLMPFAAFMVWEFAVMVGLAMPLRLALIADFALFSLPAPIFSAMETAAGMSLLPFLLALGFIIVLFVGRATRQGISALFVAVLIACILAARGLLGFEQGHHILLGLALTVAACDTAAYFVGRRIGGALLAPSVSPKKTQSGAVGGTVGAVIITAVFSQIADFPVWIALFGGIFIAVLAQAGDLFESALKRRVGVKDSGRMIPGHGGFLDRFDGYLLTLPAVYLYCLAI